MLETLKNKLGLLAKKTIPAMVSEDIRDTRLNICNSCEYILESVNVCSKCGCYLPGKTKLAKAGCPSGKWYAVVLDTKE